MTNQTTWKATLAIGGFILALSLVEVSVRIITPQSPLAQSNEVLNRGRFTSPGIHHNHQPEFSTKIEVNSQGFVDYEWNYETPNEVLFIGDSFVQGAQVPMNQSVGRILHESLSGGVTSMGVPGAGTTTELLLLEHWLPILEPKMVILGLLASNDVLNNHPELESKSDKPFINLKTWRDSQTISIEMNEPSISGQTLLGTSHLFRWYIRQTQTKQILQHKIRVGNGIPIDWHVYSPTPDDTWNEAWLITTALFKQIKELCEDRNVQFKVVLIPSIEEISPHYQRKIVTQYPSIKTWLFTQTLEHKSLQMLTAAGINSSNILSLYPTFLSHNNSTGLYFTQDHHWTELGHGLASQTIKDWLTTP